MCTCHRFAAAAAGLALLLAAQPAAAYSFVIDSFEVIKNGNAFFSDGFDGGGAPPSAPNFANGAAGGYSMLGTMGPETSGKLTLDSSGALLSANAGGAISLSQHAILQSNTQSPEVSQNGLKNDDTFRVRGVFDLIVPTGTPEGYGIRLDDRLPGVHGPQDDNLRLDVRRSGAGELEIAFRRHDFVSGAISLLDSEALELGHDQILLQLERLSASDNAVTASFAYVDGGVIGAFTVFDVTADIFNGEGFTRSGFQAFGRDAAAPAPAGLAALATGLLIMTGVRRRLQRPAAS